MNKIFSSRGLFFVAFLILFITNIIILLGVYFNRSTEPVSQLILTERELRVPHQLHKENSSFSLQLLWNSIGKKDDINQFSYLHLPFWLDKKKLEELGFDLNKLQEQKDIDEFSIPLITKEVFIVLEYDGDAFNEVIKNEKKKLKEKENLFRANPNDETLEKKYKTAKEAIKTKLKSETRLYAIDAGLNPITLNKQYNNPSKYIITKAIIQTAYGFGKKEIVGRISHLSIPIIHVPLKYRKVLDSLIDWKQQKNDYSGVYNIYYSPRFKVELAYGKRYEPWIVSIEPIEKSDKD